MLRLKYIEMYGFKSFAEKTRLNFDRDFVAVVGPNGSGKSNISDAVRWVLGEMSAKTLRGEKMEDVIFAGTSKKKAMNMAMVTLALDNSESDIDLPYEEVHISRKVFRSGESQYFINKNKVRRKDVRELFFDTGIGQEGYSLIGQGRIEDILSSQSEDRRRIFDEAAGIAKYKYKKDEAQRRLDKTEENLEIFTTDLRGKIQEEKILKKQAENARKGLELSRELEVNELSLLKNDLDKIVRDDGDLSGEKERLEADFKEQTELLNRANELLAPYNSKLNDMVTRKSQLETDREKIRTGIQKAEKDLSVKNEQVFFYKKDLERLEKSYSDREAEIEKLTIDKKLAEDNLESNKKSLNDLKEKLNALSRIEDNDQITNDLSNLSAEKDKLNEALNFLEFEKTRTIKADQALLAHQDETRKEREIKARELQDFKSKFDSLTTDQEKIVKDIEKYNQSKEDNKLEAQAVNDKISEIESGRRDKERKSAEVSSELKFLQSLLESHEGYNRPVKELLKIADRDGNIGSRMLGSLADMIRVKPGYEKAVDVALGGALQNIVVRNKDDAKFLINLIKSKNIGRITFLPLDSIEGSRPVQVKEKEVICSAVEALEYDDKLSPIVDHFLANTVLVEDLNSAVRLSDKSIRSVRIVSLDGDVINSWGSMVGGSISRRREASLLNRKTRIKDLEKDLTSINEQLIKLESLRKDELASLAALVRENEDYDKKISEARIDLDQNKDGLAELSVSINMAQELIRNLDITLARKSAYSQDEFDEKKKLLEDKIKANDKKHLEFVKKLEAGKLEAGRRDKERSIIAERISYIERDLNLAENTYNELSEQLDQSKITQDQESREKEDLVKKIGENEEFIKDAEARLKNGQVEIKNLELAAGKLESDEGALRKKLEKQLNIKEKSSALKSELENQIYRINLKIERERERRGELIDNYLSQYDISMEELDFKLEKLDPIKTTRSKVIEIKQELSAIGFFNYDSIEEYEKLSEEMDFLRKQIGDLRSSKEDILEMIEDLDKTMESLFQDSFKKINQEYNRIFKILFNGGHARLTLDSEDILSAGIDIEAQPPGKKLESLALLSGGERSMTALALLFAIFSIHPTPFCILDEIDASLDEANIGRYVNYLQTLTESTQFIIITHRKTTMELADTLYGITMEEGTSKAIFLEIEELEESLIN